MKGKIALAAALATVVTVGGVYATWSFAGGTATEATTEASIGMTGVNATIEKGTLSVMIKMADGLTMAVDDSNNDWLPELKKEGKVVVTFTPADLADSETIKEEGIDVQFKITYAAVAAGGPATLQDWKYEGTQIFQLSGDEDNTVTEYIHLEKGNATKNGNVFTWEIPASAIAIDLTDDMKDITIGNLDDYNALKTELGKGHFVLSVSECTTVHNP